MQGITIGALSRLTGVKIPTIRYYEGIGLLASPKRDANGRRAFSETDIRRLRFICSARSMDFPIEDIKALLTLIEFPESSCAKADAIARSQLGEVEQRIARLNSLRDDLKKMIDACSCESVSTCKVIDSIGDALH